MMLGLALAIAAALAVFVAYPLLSSEKEGRESLPVDVTPSLDLKRRRMVLYENLEDLEFEFQAKKIARADYETLRESYKTEAARLMLASKDLEEGTAEDALIEREVALRRAGRKNQIADAYVCAACGFRNPVPVKFCGDCGAPIAKPKGK
jgi:rubrerythrin